VINWVKDYYGIPFLGTPSPTKPTCWGNTQVSAQGITYFYQSNTDGSTINSTGLVGSDLFLIAILSNTNNWTVDGNSFNAAQAAVVTRMAKILMPGASARLSGGRDPVG